jgi:hypothetical protein
LVSKDQTSADVYYGVLVLEALAPSILFPAINREMVVEFSTVASQQASDFREILFGPLTTVLALCT